MVEFRTSSGEYCVCGSQLNRRRMGYGQKPRSARGSVSCPVCVLILWDRNFSPHVLSDLEDRQHPDLWALVRSNWRQGSRL